MNARHSRIGLVAAWTGTCVMLALTLGAQDGGGGVGVGAVGTGARNGTVRPPVPSETTPVDYFRQLLAANAEEREQLLASRPVAQHTQFRAIIRDYEQRSPEERERRLQALELRYRITSILRLAPEGRTQAVARLSLAVRPLVQERLNYWNQLTPDVQQTLLDNERLMRVITFVSAGHPAVSGRGGGSNHLGQIERAMQNFNRLPEDKRMAAEEAFRKVFELGTTQTNPGIPPLSPSEQAEMQRVLDRFKHLSPVQRGVCIRNFSKLAEMSAAERAAFLQSADVWGKMDAADRQAWKNLVKRAPVFPPLPTGFRTLPPLPVPARMVAPNMQTATNNL